MPSKGELAWHPHSIFTPHSYRDTGSLSRRSTPRPLPSFFLPLRPRTIFRPPALFLPSHPLSPDFSSLLSFPFLFSLLPFFFLFSFLHVERHHRCRHRTYAPLFSSFPPPSRSLEALFAPPIISTSPLGGDWLRYNIVRPTFPS